MAKGSMTTNSTVDLIDKTLTTENAPADAAAVGDIVLDRTKETPQPIFYSKAEVDKLLEDCKEAAKREALLAAYPVGKLWGSDDPTSPASIVGGTWEQIKDRFILAAGDTYAAGSTGGESAVTLSIDNIPSLSISIYVNGNTGYPIGCWDGGGHTGFKASVAGAGSIGEMEQDIRATYINNAIKSISTVPPYTTMYIWKRIA